jgi:hypothetical protein
MTYTATYSPEDNKLRLYSSMLGEAGGIAAARFTIEVGGRVLVADEWVVMLKLNRVGGTLDAICRLRSGRARQNSRHPAAIDNRSRKRS